MSKKILYECMKCGKTFIEKAIDGLSCCKCKKALRPLGDVDEIKEYIATMQDKLEKADRSYSKTKNNNTITIKLVLDTTEFNNKLYEVEEELQHIRTLETMIQFDKAEKIFKKFRDMVNNIDLNELKDRAERLAIGTEHIKDNRYTIQPQELSKLMKETLEKATQTLSLMTKDIMNRSNNNG